MKIVSKLAAESILIVVGILVAVMIGNAVEERNDDRMLKTYLSRIKKILKPTNKPFNTALSFLLMSGIFVCNF